MFQAILFFTYDFAKNKEYKYNRNRLRF